MDMVKSKMASIGGFLAAVGAFSIVLNILYIFEIANLEVRILMWIDTWGVTAGWAIRIGLTVVGAAIYLIFSRLSAKTESA